MTEDAPGIDRGRWHLRKAEGGKTILVARIPEDAGKLDCPKCRAPMLFVGGDQVVCYACGMSFKVDGEFAFRPLDGNDATQSAGSYPRRTTGGHDPRQRK